MVASTKPLLKVADETWVATALLQREHPERDDFEAIEIKAKALEQRSLVPGTYREISSVYQHAIQHCVANLPRQTGAYRMLYATGKTTRRLYRPWDAYDPTRDGGRMLPERTTLPSAYQTLIDWYQSPSIAESRGRYDTLLALRGSGRQVWKNETADASVLRLRDQPLSHKLDAILKLKGLGKEIWTGVDPDDYVKKLREGWE